jgi:putative hydrolase of the HAD superfamily
MNIRAVLFDADGVIQKPSAFRRKAWQDLLGRGQDVDDFVRTVWEVERHALDGAPDFIHAFSGLLADWKCTGTLEDALAAWTMIEPDSGMSRVIQQLRRQRLTCCLATNQEPHRASYMSERLGYCRLFDREYYSCRIGVAKPEAAYFRSILNDLSLSPMSVLFLDDREDNVVAARNVGLNAAQSFIDAGPSALAQTLANFGIHVDQ